MPDRKRKTERKMIEDTTTEEEIETTITIEETMVAVTHRYQMARACLGAALIGALHRIRGRAGILLMGFAHMLLLEATEEARRQNN